VLCLRGADIAEFWEMVGPKSQHTHLHDAAAFMC
jgi:hypothetical protein